MGSYFLEVFVSFLVIMNPIATVPIFLEVSTRDTLSEQRHTAVKATCIAGLILFIFAFIGDWLMNKLGISPGALLMAGGLLLLLFAIQRVFGGQSSRAPTEDEALEAQTKRDPSVFPIAIPMIAGPGALTVVMFHVKKVSHEPLYLTILCLSLVCVLLINGIILFYANHVSRALGVTGTNVITRVFGILLAAIAVQLILNGVTKFLPTLAGT